MGRAIAVLVDSRFSRLTPDEARQRLSRVGEVRETPVDGSPGVDIHVEASAPTFLVRYLGASGAWEFLHARATLGATDEKAALAIYEDYAGALRKRYGNPPWVKLTGYPAPVERYDLGDDELQLSLLQRMDERGRPVIEVELAQPQGEPY